MFKHRKRYKPFSPQPSSESEEETVVSAVEPQVQANVGRVAFQHLVNTLIARSRLLAQFETPAQFIERTQRQYLYRAIRTVETDKQLPGIGETRTLPPDGDAFADLAGSHAQRSAAYRQMGRQWAGGDIKAAEGRLLLTPVNHVTAGGLVTQFISTGSRKAAVEVTTENWEFRMAGGRFRHQRDWDPVITIDVSRLDPDIKLYDMSRSVFNEEGNDVTRFAERDAEVLISPRINSSAIIHVDTDFANFLPKP